MDDKIIQNWVEEKIVTAEQAVKMRASLSRTKSEKRSNNIILSLSSIGALFFGLGALFFMASNWDLMPDFIKTTILFCATFGFYTGGYILKYQRANFPKVGYSLMFLSTILFGTSLMLLAQIYNVNANNHTLILIWIVAILPVVYGFRQKLVGYLASVLFYAWLLTYLIEVFDRIDASGSFDSAFIIFLIIIMSCSILLIKFAEVHGLSERFKDLGTPYRGLGLIAGLGTLFIMTFDIYPDDRYYSRSLAEVERLSIFEQLPSEIKAPLLLILLVTIVSLSVSGTYHFLKTNSRSQLVANFLMFLMVIVPVNGLFVTDDWTGVSFLANVLFPTIVIFIIMLGYKRENSAYVNYGYLLLFIFLLTKYFSWFWDLFESFIFFSLAGLILLGGGVWLERNRRNINAKFKHKNDESE